MIITRTPFRISFVGGGSDLKSFYSKESGAVLSTSINKYMYISSHKFFDKDKLRVKYSKTETVSEIDDIDHPILKNVLKHFKINGGIEISSIADIHSGTGMGSSSAFTVGLLHNLYVVKRNYVSKETLAKEACRFEIDVLKEPIGKQDQYAAAFGGLNIIHFLTNDTVIVEPLYIKRELIQSLQDNLILFYVGKQRKASDILSEQKKNIEQQEMFNIQKAMVKLVFDLKDCLYNERLDDFGKILHENWILKQKLASKISNPEINDIYKTALSAGATGGKLLGAGGGGFMLFYANKALHKKIVNALKSLNNYKFQFETDGSKLIYYGDENTCD
ncbi:MAG: GHMP kinase [Bacteroidales bacterium]|nr:GHMP kinase [Bacteroidales bacterium]